MKNGIVLISGAACLKVGAAVGSWSFLLAGYGALIAVCFFYVQNWRDKQ